MVGRTIAHYQIVEKLGEGGMGVVYKARDTHLGRFVAIKLLLPDKVADPERKRRFVQEAKAASSLNHPNIITIYDIASEDGLDFIAMEFVPGKTLDRLIPGTGMGLNQALKCAVQIADALAAAHQAGIVHRDLKPGNIVVDERGLVTLLDFGLAKLTERTAGMGEDASTRTMQAQTAEGAIVGTVAYMSPEQAEGKPVDARSDIFSFGSVLYEMVTGQRAFAEQTKVATLGAVLHLEPKPISELTSGMPPELEKIVARCLRKDPESRIQHMGDVRLALEELRQDSASASVAAPAVEKRTRGWRVWRTAATAAAFGLVALLLALGLNVGRLRDRVFGGAAPARIEAIVVLPLQNLSGDPQQEYFVDGMTEELTTDLAKIRGVKVISRTSAMRYKGTNKALREIAGELKVDAVIEGSALRVGDRVRITAQLIDAQTDRHLWAESYDRDLRDVLLLQGEVARAIAREIQVALTPEETRRLSGARRVNPEAYEAYLKGRLHWYKLSPEGLQRALEYFQLSLEKDPNYALAYTGIADVWGARAFWGMISPVEAMPKAAAAASKAIELDDSLAEGHALLASVGLYRKWDWDGAEKEIHRAIELRPNYADVRANYSFLLAAMKRPAEATAQIERALQLDPLNPLSQVMRGAVFGFVGRYDDSIQQSRATLSKEPNIPAAHYCLWAALGAKQMHEEGFAAAKNFLTLLGNREVVDSLTRGYAEAGYPGAMRLAAENLAARSKATYVSPIWIAALYAHAGEKKHALAWLEKAYEERNPHMAYVNVDPHWGNLRDEPGFQDLLRRMKLPL